MIDVHTHILWGLDDGAGSRDESLAMLRLAAGCGTTGIVATPHADLNFDYDRNLVEQRISDLEQEISHPKIYCGCDFHLSFDNVQRALAEPARFTINGRNHLLVEFADTLVPPVTEEIFRQFAARGIVPVITHPERNPILRESLDRLQFWVQSGCLLQVTAQSLTDRFGRAAQRAAWELLRRGLVHVIASDAHDAENRPPRLDQAREILARELGQDAARLLLVENPAAIVNGDKVLMAAPGTAGTWPKSWFQFWK
jgi:protein-tyrosine phosphatase